MIKVLSNNKKKEWEGIEDEEERRQRKNLKEIKDNVWMWRGKKKILKEDPRDKLASDKKIEILEELIKAENGE